MENYGLTPMSLEQEAKASKAVRMTRNAKVSIQADCALLIRLAESIIDYAQKIPEDDDIDHCQLVTEYARGIRKAHQMLLDNEMMKYPKEKEVEENEG